MNNLFDLNGKVALVTGAGSGLGASAAKAYAEYGADVALLDLGTEQTEQIAKEIEAMGRKAVAIKCNVANEENVKQAVGEAIEKLGKVDILLNNAGVAVSGSVESMTEEEWNLINDVNLKGVFLVSKYVLPGMRERKYGKVVNISSVNSLIADKSPMLVRHAYNATKAGVRGLTIGMAASYGIDNITVNAICPGLFKTGMTKDSLFKAEEFLQTYNALNPMGRPANDGELNGTVLFLSSDASAYVNGQWIAVDGGITIV